MVKKKAMCSLQTDMPGADIGMIKIRELHDFKEHPFKVERNQNSLSCAEVFSRKVYWCRCWSVKIWMAANAMKFCS